MNLRAGLKSFRDALRSPTAGYLRRLWPPVTVVCVTGTSGKTTTAGLLGALFAEVGRTKTWAFRNTPDAVARNIFHTWPFGLKFLVHEIGAGDPGALAAMTATLRPDVGVVTLVDLEHRKKFRDRAQVAAEKSALPQMLPESGLAVLNGDDPHVRAMAELTEARVVTFGRREGCDLRLEQAHYSWPAGLRMRVVYRNEPIDLTSPLVGEHWTVSIMAAVLTGLEKGVDRQTCIDVVAGFMPQLQRLSLHQRRGGGLYILDSAKAPHWSLEKSFSVLKHFDAPRKTIIVGTISDTSGTRRKSYNFAARAALAVADRVIFTGPQAGGIRTEMDRQPDAPLHQIEAYNALRTLLADDVVKGEVILIKASGMDHLERLMYEDHGPVACRRERCRLPGSCDGCPNLVGGNRTEFRRQRELWIDKAERLVRSADT